MSRLELAVMLVRAEGLDQEARSTTTAPVQMVGYQSLPTWSRGYVSYAIALGLLDDEDLNNFRPNDDALRYQRTARPSPSRTCGWGPMWRLRPPATAPPG